MFIIPASEYLGMGLAITRIESMEFSYPLEDIGTDKAGFNLVYDPGSAIELTRTPRYEGGYSDMIETIDNNGTVSVPDGPGLGVEYVWSYITDNQTERVHVYE